MSCLYSPLLLPVQSLLYAQTDAAIVELNLKEALSPSTNNNFPEDYLVRLTLFELLVDSIARRLLS